MESKLYYRYLTLLVYTCKLIRKKKQRGIVSKVGFLLKITPIMCRFQNVIAICFYLEPIEIENLKNPSKCYMK